MIFLNWSWFGLRYHAGEGGYSAWINDSTVRPRPMVGTTLHPAGEAISTYIFGKEHSSLKSPRWSVLVALTKPIT